ncbi:YggS family pyridoxal phosphate-dependent enzyme [Leptolyngbya iicbica]|uniref:Pyridoxal phosphate homeostasis protein n=2 Tax=Cyanophyceae TaxID=3028117 RepID=A0A4Q7EM26_9CYAN|nr:YggS family pyridoxal phosphate-dependent enzyme [Leptolyngbya sp. LK]RZM82859.1 YggS family pyridoxal phosphate-dependent enzyme [Leptolyngbya sp. LK]
MTASPSTNSIADRITIITRDLPPQVRLIGVSKRQPASAVRAAYQANLRDFGESMVQEAIAKQAELTDLDDITWHLIGHLQSNKARKALEHFDWIHSIDSLKIATRLDKIAGEIGRSPYCCLQVKMVPDPAKFGFSLEELWAALPELNQLRHLNIVGVMTIPPLESSMAEVEAIFERAKILANQINQQGFDQLHLSELSMGMSGDYPVAIAAGSTMIRLGTTLFGDRPA